MVDAQYTIKRREPLSEMLLSSTLHPVLKRVLQNRGVDNAEEIDYSLETLHPIDKLTGLQQAIDLLVQALQTKQRILIVGDFDADGATSTAVAIRALHAMGAEQVEYRVPNRFEYGYGLTPEIVEVAQEAKPDVLITVDNGISSVAGVEAANALGIKVIITDHHLPGDVLPAAAAIVNPNLEYSEFPSKNLAGVGVIFYVMLGLRAELRKINWFVENNLPEPNLATLLDLVALGTVADVVPLDQNNRTLVEQGIRRIRADKCCVGIQALLNVGNRQRKQLVATDLGYVVAPRLNAAGRLQDMSIGIECLLTDNADLAHQYASELDAMNKERRDIEKQMQDQAFEELDRLNSELENKSLPAGLCLYDERWHQGVVGILAARVKEKVHRPVIAFAKVSDQEIKGSARSIPGLHIRDALDVVATQNPGLVSKFGGHAMAAGLSLHIDNFEVFSKAFEEQVAEQLASAPGDAVILSDGELAANELNIKTAEYLRNAGPWGQGFPAPVFDGVFSVVDARIVGESHLKLKLKLLDSYLTIDGIAFNRTDECLAKDTDKVRVAYHLDANEFRGKRTVQLNIQHLEPFYN